MTKADILGTSKGHNMKIFKITLFVIMGLIAIPNTTHYSQAEILVQEELPIGKEHYIPMMEKYAQKYQIKTIQISRIIDCENGNYDPTKQSLHRYSTGQIDRHPEWGEVGEREKSFGLVQIHLPAGHTWQGEKVTEEMAKDPELSIEFLAYHISKGHQSWWSCSELIGII